jgi:hypothetical protein
MAKTKQATKSVREKSREIAHYLGIIWDESFYQHLNRVVKGEMEPTAEERRAFELWEQTEANPHELAAQLQVIKSHRRSIEKLKQCVQSGIYNTPQTVKTIDKLLKALG